MSRYYFEVEELVTTFKKDPGGNDSFTHTTKFEPSDSMTLFQCRAEAVNFYNERLVGLEKAGRYFLSFASQSNFKPGENAAYSVDLILVCEEMSEGFGSISDHREEYSYTDEDEEVIDELGAWRNTCLALGSNIRSFRAHIKPHLKTSKKGHFNTP